MPAPQISPDTRHTFTDRGYLVLPDQVAETTLEELAPSTRDAYLELAAAVADGFVANPNHS